MISIDTIRHCWLVTDGEEFRWWSNFRLADDDCYHQNYLAQRTRRKPTWIVRDVLKNPLESLTHPDVLQ